MFETGWWAFGLGNHRHCGDTYCLSDYESLPPLDMAMFQGEFDWLPPLDTKTRDAMEIYWTSQQHQDKMAEQLGVIQAAGLTLPPGFVKFMGSTELQRRIPSCTACYFELSEIIPNLFEPDTYMIRFLHDQQSAPLWYLYLKQDGSHSVIVSSYHLDHGYYTVEEMKPDCRFCAPTFESFIYRFWIENVIWYALNEITDQLLTPEQQTYLNHYPLRKNDV